MTQISNKAVAQLRKLEGDWNWKAIFSDVEKDKRVARLITDRNSKKCSSMYNEKQSVSVACDLWVSVFETASLDTSLNHIREQS